MDISTIIRELDAAIALASIGALEPIGSDARRAIAASSQRAQLCEKRLSAAARMSIACAGMSFAAALARQEVDTPSRTLSAIAAHASTIAPQFPIKHDPDTKSEAPEGWAGSIGGPFWKDAEDGTAVTLARRPHLPGGDWTFFYGPLPAAFGRSPEEASRNGDSFCRAVIASRRRPPSPGFIHGFRAGVPAS